VGREMDQTNYNLRNTATDLTLPKPKRELKKKALNIVVLCTGTSSQMKRN
jgi:hypothetical protein